MLRKELMKSTMQRFTFNGNSGMEGIADHEIFQIEPESVWIDLKHLRIYSMLMMIG
jgi:hypothetical protein